jgi:signal transduction histidine kinase/ligand-binding sensor domain-containing protein
MIMWKGWFTIKAMNLKLFLQRSSIIAYGEEVFRTLHQLRYLLLTALSLSVYSNSYGQPKLLQFKHLTVADGLSSSSVESILQDNRGFMWLGTPDGVNRYDGVNIITYKNIWSDSSSLLSDYVRTIYEDRKKNLFIGTSGGLNLYDRESDNFINFRNDSSSALFGIKSLVRRIAEDTNGNLWLATDSGLVFLDRANNKAKKYQNHPSNPSSINDNDLEAVYIDKSMRLWIGTIKGVDLFERETGTFKHINTCKTHNDTIPSLYVLDIIEDRQGNIWFGSSDGLFCLQNRSAHDNFELTHFKNDPKDRESLSNNRVKTLFVDSEGKLWIGTENGGINLFDTTNNKFRQYRINEFNPMSLNNESIHSIAQDRNNNLWFGTWGGGVNISIENSDFIIHYRNVPGAAQSLSFNIVSSFVEDRLHRIWVGTDGGGFNLFDGTTGCFQRFNTRNTAIKSDAVIAMHRGKDNTIWLGTWEGGLVNFDYDHNTVQSFTTDNSGIPDNSIFSIADDSLGNLWLGSFRHGLIYYQIKEKKFTVYTPKKFNMLNDDVSVVKIDSKGRVYMVPGSGSDIYIFNPVENRFVTHSVLTDSVHRGAMNVFDILIESDTCIWAATRQGLYRFNPENGYHRWYFMENGSSNTAIKGLTLDKTGVLWLTTNSGISRFDYQTNNVKIFSVSDGLQGTDFKKANIFTTVDGSILAGGTNGFNVINPEKIPQNTKVPEVVLTDFHIFNKNVKIGVDRSSLKKQLSETDTLFLTYKQSVFTLFFTALDFTNPSKNQYAYKMVNFDKIWTYCGNRKEATYTNLDPGRYQFQVKAANNDGVWNETGTTLEIIITPPWWKTKTATIFFVFTVICILLGIYYFRINQLEKHKKLLEILVRKRTFEIETKNRILSKQADDLRERQEFIDLQTRELSASNNKLLALNETKDKLFSIIAHDLKNPFTTILGIHDMLAHRYDSINDGKRKHMLEVVYKSSMRIFKLLETLLDWARTQTGKINCNAEEFVLNEIIDDISLFVENIASEKKIVINQCIEKKVVVFADKNMINTVIRNLMANAIKFTENGTIRIEADESPKLVTVKIIDSGVGMGPEKTATLFDSINTGSTFGTRGETGTGLGLVICREFIERHGGIMAVESEIGKGSTFSFTIPKNVMIENFEQHNEGPYRQKV